MVREQDVIAGYGGKVSKPINLRDMLRSSSDAANADQRLFLWIAKCAALCGLECSIVGNISGRQSADDNIFVLDLGIIQHSDACGCQNAEIIRIQHPLVITEG